MSKTSEVWLSRILNDTTLIKYFDADIFLSDKELALETMRGNKVGKSYPADRFPKEIYGMYPDNRYKRMPDIFNAGGNWCVSATCASVLREFDLGQGGLYPVKLFQHDRTSTVEGDYLCLNFGNVKQAVVVEESTGFTIKPPWSSHEAEWLSDPKDDDIAVSPVALDGPDLWLDPQVFNSVFLSDRLVQALRAAKLTRRWGLRTCRLIPPR